MPNEHLITYSISSASKANEQIPTPLTLNPNPNPKTLQKKWPEY